MLFNSLLLTAWQRSLRIWAFVPLASLLVLVLSLSRRLFSSATCCLPLLLSHSHLIISLTCWTLGCKLICNQATRSLPDCSGQTFRLMVTPPPSPDWDVASFLRQTLQASVSCFRSWTHPTTGFCLPLPETLRREFFKPCYLLQYTHQFDSRVLAPELLLVPNVL